MSQILAGDIGRALLLAGAQKRKAGSEEAGVASS